MGASMLPEPSHASMRAHGASPERIGEELATPAFAVVRTVHDGPRGAGAGAGGYGRMGPW
jgi:hypothetical protein